MRGSVVSNLLSHHRVTEDGEEKTLNCKNREDAEAVLQSGKSAETYFPARPIGPKKLEKTIEILRPGMT